MIQKLKTHLASTSALTTLFLSSTAFAARIESPGLRTDLVGIINTLLTYVLGIAGAIAVIYLIYGGFLYLTSGGSEKGVTAGKNTIMYAIVGLVIIALAFAIKTYVMGLIAPGAPEIL